MSLKSALVVSTAIRGMQQLSELLAQCGIEHVERVETATEARHVLETAEFDLYIINSPLTRSETVDALARDLTARLAGEVIVLVREDKLQETSRRLTELGVYTVSKPLNRDEFSSIVKLAAASHSRVGLIRRENEKLKQSIEDIKVINRAKIVLVSRLAMSEPEAHKYIEKQAMDMRKTSRAVADGILKTHEG